MRNYKISVLLFLFLAVLVNSCKQEIDATEPKKYISASEGFEIISADTLLNSITSGTRFNFLPTSPSYYFESEFNQTVSWTVKVTGLSSGAVKSLKGTSSVINQESATWYGDSDGLPFFQKRESVKVELSILGLGVIYTELGYSVFNVPSYNDRYILVTDVDANPAEAVSDLYQYFDSDKTLTEVDDDEGISIGVAGTATKYGITVPVPVDRLSPVGGPLKPMQGESYFHIEGIDGKGLSTFFVGGMTTNDIQFIPRFQAIGWLNVLDENSTATDTIVYNDQLDYIAENLFINAYVSSNGNKTTRIDLELRETIEPADWFALTGLEVSDAVEQDKLVRSIDINWEGWKLVSVKMSNMTWHPQENAGNKVWEWNKFHRVAVGVLAGNDGAQGSPVDANIDFITLSLGAPFNQKLD